MDLSYTNSVIFKLVVLLMSANLENHGQRSKEADADDDGGRPRPPLPTPLKLVQQSRDHRVDLGSLLAQPQGKQHDEEHERPRRAVADERQGRRDGDERQAAS